MNDQTEWILSISLAAHDGAVTLLKNGKVELHLKEERISRSKHDSAFPFSSFKVVAEYTRSISKLLLANVTPDITKSIFFQLEKYRISALEVSEEICESSDEHHLLHAASGFYFSEFNHAICLVMDGWGSASHGVYSLASEGFPFGPIIVDETTSIYEAKFPDKIELVKKYGVYDPNRRDGLHDLQCNNCKWESGTSNVRVPSVKQFFETNDKMVVSSHMDIGVMYGVVSAFLGFDNIDCGKTMGLSAYGEEDDTLPPFFIEGTLTSNKNLFTQSRTLDKENYPVLNTINESKQKRANLAYKIQKSLEKKFIERVSYIDENFECKNIVISGGCALNIVANGLLLEKFPHLNFFIDPIPNDSGQSLGMALLWHYQNGPKEISKPNINTTFLGPHYSKEELEERIREAV